MDEMSFCSLSLWERVGVPKVVAKEDGFFSFSVSPSFAPHPGALPEGEGESAVCHIIRLLRQLIL
jgi:hypothetical protein